MAKKRTLEEAMREEEEIQEKKDKDGQVWRKIYFGGGSHFRNWLEQCREVYGKGNIAIEETEAEGFRCFELSGEKMFRIWVRVVK